jgi:hypothetical protein
LLDATRWGSAARWQVLGVIAFDVTRSTRNQGCALMMWNTDMCPRMLDTVAGHSGFFATADAGLLVAKADMRAFSRRFDDVKAL